MKRLPAILLVLLAAPAWAQTPSYPVGGGPQGQRAPATVELCLNSQGQAVPLALCDQAPNIAKPLQPATTEHRATVVTISPNSGSASAYPSNATPLTANAAGTTGAVVGTYAASPGRTNFICGFEVSAIGGTAAVGPITIAGLTGSSMVFQGSASVAGGTVAQKTFSPCIPASAANTAITVTTTADGTATAVNVNSWGYRQ